MTPMQYGPHALSYLTRRYPLAEKPEILTARENLARHLAADLAEAVGSLHHTLATHQFTAVDDDTDFLDDAGSALVAALALVQLFGDPDELLADRFAVGPLFQLSTILSVTTGKLIAAPSDIVDLLGWVTGRPVALGTDAAREAGTIAGAALIDQFPELADRSLPGLPATADTDTVDHDRPESLARWVAKIAESLGYDSPDPWLEVRQSR